MPDVSSFKASSEAFYPLRFAAIKPPKQFDQSAGVAAEQAIVQRAFLQNRVRIAGAILAICWKFKPSPTGWIVVYFAV